MAPANPARRLSKLKLCPPTRVPCSPVQSLNFGKGFIGDRSESNLIGYSVQGDIVRYPHDHVAALWARASDFRFEMFNDPNDEVPECGRKDAAELRLAYPELTMLSDGSLFELFDAFQMEVWSNRGWVAGLCFPIARGVLSCSCRTY